MPSIGTFGEFLRKIQHSQDDEAIAFFKEVFASVGTELDSIQNLIPISFSCSLERAKALAASVGLQIVEGSSSTNYLSWVKNHSITELYYNRFVENIRDCLDIIREADNPFEALATLQKKYRTHGLQFVLADSFEMANQITGAKCISEVQQGLYLAYYPFIPPG